MALDSLQLGVQEAGQQLENKVLLLLTWHVPTHTQGRHISGSAPVLERWERVRDRKRERGFSQKVFFPLEQRASHQSTWNTTTKSCVIYWCLSTQNLRSTIRSHTNRWIQPKKYLKNKRNSMKIKSEQKTESAILNRRWKEGQHLTPWRNVGVIALCKNKTENCQGFWRNRFQRSFFSLSLSRRTTERTDRARGSDRLPLPQKQKQTREASSLNSLFFSGVKVRLKRAHHVQWISNETLMSPFSAEWTQTASLSVAWTLARGG